MAEVSVQVPASVVPAIRNVVVLLYRATAEALHLSLGAHAVGDEPLREVRRHHARLRALDSVVEQLGWPGDVVSDAVDLAGPRAVLHDALHGALIDAGERLGVAAAAGWRSEASSASVRDAAAEVIALDRLVREVEPKGGR
jgi:hypothetical protein